MALTFIQIHYLCIPKSTNITFIRLSSYFFMNFVHLNRQYGHDEKLFDKYRFYNVKNRGEIYAQRYHHLQLIELFITKSIDYFNYNCLKCIVMTIGSLYLTQIICTWALSGQQCFVIFQPVYTLGFDPEQLFQIAG